MRSRVDFSHRSAVDIPEVQPGPRARHDVSCQLVDGHGCHRPNVAGHVLDVDVASEVPDDGRSIARS